MQRMIESVVINKILNKYKERYEECEQQWKNDSAELLELQLNDNQDRINFILNDITSLNAQLSAYECIIKDLKELVK